MNITMCNIFIKIKQIYLENIHKKLLSININKKKSILMRFYEFEIEATKLHCSF